MEFGFDGASALVHIRDFHPDALVTDLEMSGMDGLSLISALRSSDNPIQRDIPIIVCSSKVDNQTIAELRKLGADAIVPKPVNVKLLAETALRLFKAV
ncbi:response regulator [Rubripirellula reticaptiva]|uniref:Chemotaxis protein CheY n=1 Tax=Rubripirellula reticaptiva TaxID=2528013 RepID=A0A5C6EFQ2_9BACT|nr:response regulator [Rubripirellula reticaptiva]TWU46521.1 Chemotaxis protein CheY [Rubripirellula reticaptiva]